MARRQGIKRLAVVLGVITPLPLFFFITDSTNPLETQQVVDDTLLWRLCLGCRSPSLGGWSMGSVMSLTCLRVDLGYTLPKPQAKIGYGR